MMPNSKQHGKKRQPVVAMLARMLRHAPETYRVQVDGEGWADTPLVLAALWSRRRQLGLWEPWTLSHLERFLQQHADRFERAGSRIRARYGHSLPVTVGTIRTPPDVLYHGTKFSLLPSIASNGLVPRRRRFVHLTSDARYAAEVADCAEGAGTIIGIKARETAQSCGIVFRQATDHVWLVAKLPVTSFISAHARPQDAILHCERGVPLAKARPNFWSRGHGA